MKRNRVQVQTWNYKSGGYSEIPKYFTGKNKYSPKLKHNNDKPIKGINPQSNKRNLKLTHSYSFEKHLRTQLPLFQKLNFVDDDARTTVKLWTICPLLIINRLEKLKHLLPDLTWWSFDNEALDSSSTCWHSNHQLDGKPDKPK